MQSDRLVRICLVTMTVLLTLVALRPIFAPGGVYAQKHYEYELVKVGSIDVQDVLAKRTKEGWEPITLSFFYWTGSALNGEGFLLLRK